MPLTVLLKPLTYWLVQWSQQISAIFHGFADQPNGCISWKSAKSLLARWNCSLSAEELQIMFDAISGASLASVQLRCVESYITNTPCDLPLANLIS